MRRSDLLISKRAKYLLILLVLLAFNASAALAQYSETTGTIQGTVKDPTGAVIPGASVEVSSPALIGTRQAQTDSAGFYRFAFLPPGEYKVAVTASGFSRKEEVGIRLEVGKVLPIDFSLEVGAVTQTVEVQAASVIVDTQRSAAAVNISPIAITGIPKGRSFQDLIPYAPGARQEPLQAGFQLDGASDGENVYAVEGMDTTNIQYGGVGVNVPLDFVEEVNIKTSGFEAEYGGALGGVVNVITKRGSNTWHGSGLLYYRSDAFDAFPRPGLRLNPLDTVVGRTSERPEYYQYQADKWRILEPGFELGGYIRKDKLWLYTSYIPSLEKRSRTVNFTWAPTGGTAVGARTFLRTDTTHFAVGRLDYSPTARVRISSNWQYAPRRWMGDLPTQDSVDRLLPNGDAGSDPSTWRQERGRVYNNSAYVATAYFTINPKMLASVRWGYWFTNEADRGLPSGIRYQYLRSSIGFVGLDGTAVPAPYQQRSGFQTLPEIRQTVFDYRTRMGLAADYSYMVRAMGSHNLKAGYAMNRLHNDVDYEPFTGWVRPYWGYDYTPILASGQAVCAQLRTQNEANYGRAVCEGIFGVYRIIDFSTIGNVASFNHSLYVQDAWNLGGRLTLNLGVRFDKEYLPSFAVAQNIPSKAVQFGFTDKVAPRLGAAFDVLGNGKLKVFGSWGLFYDIMKYEMPRGSFGGDYWHDCWYTLDTYVYTNIVPQKDPNGHACPGIPTIGTKIEEIDWRIPSNDPDNYTIEPNLRPMRQRELVFGAEYALTSDIGLELRYARKRLDRTIEDNGMLDPLYGERYYIANPGEGLAKNVFRPPAASTVTCATCPDGPKAMRRYDGLEVRLNKRWSKNWFANVSYTYSRLWGNYGGLTSTDESGRHSPNVNRYFDLPHMAWDSHGKVAEGFLPTDRPHTFKLYGAYRLKWWGMESTFGVVQLAYSGSPVTTEINIISSTPIEVENRANFQELSQDAQGNWVRGALKKNFRTEAFTNTNFLFLHEFKLSKTNEALRAAFEVNITNLFNQMNTLRFNFNPLREGQINFIDPDTGGDDWAAFFRGFDWVTMANTQDEGLVYDRRYGMPNLFQDPRSFRLKVKLSF